MTKITRLKTNHSFTRVAKQKGKNYIYILDFEAGLRSSLNTQTNEIKIFIMASASKHLTKVFSDNVAFTLCPLHITGPVQKKYIRNTQHVKNRNIHSTPSPPKKRRSLFEEERVRLCCIDDSSGNLLNLWK